jgi:hypothetical protein
MKNNLRIFGFISTIIVFLCCVVSLVLSSVDFNVLYATWSSSYYKYLAPCSLASTSFGVLVSLIGMMVFLLRLNSLLLIFIILLLLSTLASWGTSIISIMGGRIKHKNNGLLGCSTKLTGVLEIYENIDNYLMYVNSLFCSEACNCKNYKFNEFDFTDNYYSKELANEFNNKEVNEDNDDNKGKTSFQECRSELLDEARNRYLEHPNSTQYPIKTKKFHKYFKKLEKRFKCTGWCKTAYKDPYTLDNRFIVKYLFSNSEKEVPHYFGCMNILYKWLPRFVMSTGILMLIASCFETICLLISTNLIGNEDDNNYNDVDDGNNEENNNEDINNVENSKNVENENNN